MMNKHAVKGMRVAASYSLSSLFWVSGITHFPYQEIIFYCNRKKLRKYTLQPTVAMHIAEAILANTKMHQKNNNG